MAFFRIKVEDKVYELDRWTLGEARILKREFGMEDLTSFNPADPNQLAGLLCLALLRENPERPLGSVLAEVEEFDVELIESAPEPEPERDPTPAGSAGEDATPRDGSPETTRVVPGPPPSENASD